MNEKGEERGENRDKRGEKRKKREQRKWKREETGEEATGERRTDSWKQEERYRQKNSSTDRQREGEFISSKHLFNSCVLTLCSKCTAISGAKPLREKQWRCQQTNRDIRTQNKMAR